MKFNIWDKSFGIFIALLVFSASIFTANANLLNNNSVYSGNFEFSKLQGCDEFKIKFMETEVTSEDFPTQDPIDEQKNLGKTEDTPEKLNVKISITDSTKVYEEKPEMLELQKAISVNSKAEDKGYIPAPEDTLHNNILVIASLALSFVVILAGIICIIYRNKTKK